MAVVETRKKKIKYNGQDNVYSVSLGRTSREASMDPYPSPAEKEHPKNKCTNQRIGRGIAEATTVS